VVGRVTVVVKVINVSVDIDAVRDSKQYRLAEVPST
jgi:hypothetical protein